LTSDRIRRDARRQLASLRIVTPYTAKQERFHYDYLPRLLDDQDIANIRDSRIRSGVRAAHREAYWQSLGLLKRDIGRVVDARRNLMDAHQRWRFEELIGDSLRLTRLLWKLRLAGAAHALRVPGVARQVRETCTELQRLMQAPLTSAPAFRAA
jgi:hypothetical protein